MNAMREVTADEMRQVEGGTYIGWGMAIAAGVALSYGVPALYNWVSQRIQTSWRSHMSHSANYGTSHYNYDYSPGHITFNDSASRHHYY